MAFIMVCLFIEFPIYHVSLPLFYDQGCFIYKFSLSHQPYFAYLFCVVVACTFNIAVLYFNAVSVEHGIACALVDEFPDEWLSTEFFIDCIFFNKVTPLLFPWNGLFNEFVQPLSDLFGQHLNDASPLANNSTSHDKSNFYLFCTL